MDQLTNVVITNNIVYTFLDPLDAELLEIMIFRSYSSGNILTLLIYFKIIKPFESGKTFQINFNPIPISPASGCDYSTNRRFVIASAESNAITFRIFDNFGEMLQSGNTFSIKTTHVRTM